jgi:hypothetical protein
MNGKCRQPEYEDRVFTDKEGKPYEGQMVEMIPDMDTVSGFRSTHLWYDNGKLHGKPAIKYPDGQEEEWNNGKFVSVMKLPYKER